MNKRISEQRMIQNEAVFRQANESIQKGIDKVNAGIMESGDAKPIDEVKTILHFYCECSDENCRERIELSLEKYTAIHENRKQFIVKPGHQVSSIEDTLTKTREYTVVKKQKTPPENPGSLQLTDVSNI